MEDNLTGRRPCRKTTLKEDDLRGRWPQRKTTSEEDDLIGRQPHKKKTTQEDNFTGRQPQRMIISHEDNLTGRQPYWKTSLQEDELTGRWPHRKTTSQEDELTGRWAWHSSAPACLYYYDYTLGYIYILPYSFKRICLPGSNKHCLERSILSQKKWFSIMEYSSVTLDWFCRKKLLLLARLL